ncbi:hypothetical protein BDN70DRAFT_721686 [Pholiota conissans]|uniref:Uncharacterized protein n=1 Tax=Pholiota conissans TaxID=109636 RepID=A0A9P5Z3T1_9AGAR|nr:hypothetical protein BDN70DRAFT_721686 [Pholiota conissans]
MDNITTEHANAYTQDSTQGFGDIQDTDWSSDQFQAIEDSLLIPELMLTVPTPEVGYAPVDFTSRANASLGSCGDALIGHRGTQRLTSDASLGPNVVEWSPLSLYLGTDLQLSSEKRVCEASSGRDDRIYSAIEPSRTLPGGSLLNAIARKLDISRTSGFAKNRPSGDGKLGHVRRFWKRFSAIGTPVPSANGKSDQGSNIFDECIGATENLTSADRPMATTCLSPGAEASAETWAEKRHSRLPSFSAGACVIEEGEHAASRLFGTSNTGRTKDNCEKHVNERQARVDKENNSKAGRQTRRHSFGFDLKDLNGRKRHLRNDSLLDVESTTVETGSKRFWRRTYSPLE